VGKTWLLTEFGKTAFDDVVYLNFENTPGLNELFLGNLEPQRIIDMLGALHGKKIIPEKTLIIFDEVQEAPRALTALKYVAKKRPRISHLLCGLAIGCSAPCGHIISRWKS
jgi:predicted AAA+ superfamily ATPase